MGAARDAAGGAQGPAPEDGEHLSAFDEALYELSKERLVLSADLKAAEVRLLVALQEFEMLQGFEHRDVSMASKLDKCQREKGEVVANITEVQSRLKAKREELVRCTEEDKEINDEFLSMVPQGHAFHQQLFKIFKRKIKRSKKRDDGDDEDDDDEDDDDDDDYDDDEEDEEEEEVDDYVPAWVRHAAARERPRAAREAAGPGGQAERPPEGHRRAGPHPDALRGARKSRSTRT